MLRRGVLWDNIWEIVYFVQREGGLENDSSASQTGGRNLSQCEAAGLRPGQIHVQTSLAFEGWGPKRWPLAGIYCFSQGVWEPAAPQQGPWGAGAPQNKAVVWGAAAPKESAKMNMRLFVA